MNTEKIKVAIFLALEHSINYDDYETIIKEKITDWTDVSLEEYEMLSKYLGGVHIDHGKLILIRQITEDNTDMSLSKILEQVKKIDIIQKQRLAKQKKDSEKRAKLAEVNKKKRELKKLDELKVKVAELEKLKNLK